jgi:hypothetical protein
MKKSMFALIVLLSMSQVFAHHAVNSQFDVSKNVELTGVLTKVELINPHSYMYFDVTGSDKMVVNYSIETGAPAALRRAGLSAREALKVGDTYKFVICPSRDGSPTGLMSSLTLPDGRSFKFGARNNVDPGQDQDPTSP